MAVIKVILVTITILLLITNEISESEHYKERFIINFVLMLYLVYLLLT